MSNGLFIVLLSIGVAGFLYFLHRINQRDLKRYYRQYRYDTRKPKEKHRRKKRL